MLLTKFSHTLLVRAAAVASILLGMLYLPSVFHFTLSIHGFEPELGRGSHIIEEEWGKWSIIGGGLLFIGSLMLRPYRSAWLRNLLLGFLFICLILLITAQLPPLLIWFIMNLLVFSWSNALGFLLHFLFAALALWGSASTLYAFEKNRLSSEITD
ncbi:hypothetical protein PALU110988_09000 [Paenibacillus lupini]